MRQKLARKAASAKRVGEVVCNEAGDLVRQELSFSSLCTSILLMREVSHIALAPNRVLQSSTVKANAFQPGGVAGCL
jgi:hypothetical protein